MVVKGNYIIGVVNGIEKYEILQVFFKNVFLEIIFYIWNICSVQF